MLRAVSEIPSSLLLRDTSMSGVVLVCVPRFASGIQLPRSAFLLLGGETSLNISALFQEKKLPCTVPSIFLR